MSTGTLRRSLRIKGRAQQSTSSTPDSRSDGGELEDFTCNSCQKTFLSKYTLLMHVFIHIDGVKPPLHACRLCGDVFASRRSLCLHSKKRENQCTTANKGDRVLQSNNKRAFCQKLQSRQCQRDRLGNGQENESLSSCDRSFQQAEIEFSQPESARSGRYQTRISKDALPKRQQHQAQTRKGPNARHKRNISFVSPAHRKGVIDYLENLPFKCNDCDRFFRYKVHLKRHAVSHQKKLFLCNYCDRTFRRPVDLRQHTFSHTGEKPHACKCGKSFAKSCTLKRHEMVHKGVRPYTCKVCFKSFTDSWVLRNHAAVHTGERAYACCECDKRFKEAGHLRRHLLLHTGEKPYECHTCGVRFNQPASLKRHHRVHTGERPYKCDVCSKAFADRSNWRAHAFARHAERCLECDVCERRFVKRYDLVQHVRVHIL